MGIRYQKRISLGKFVNLNISKSGVGASVGITGLRLTTGPSGTIFTIGLPGTGLSYRHHIGKGKWFSWSNVFNWGGSGNNQAQTNTANTSVPTLPEPGWFASSEEKALANGLKALSNQQLEEALQQFQSAATNEAGAAIMAAKLLADNPAPSQKRRAIPLLEQIVFSDEQFPTELMQKYLVNGTMDINITPTIIATVPLEGLAAVLLLVELYQIQHRLDEAIALLEEVEELSGNPVLTLSLCDLYVEESLWDGVIDRASQVESEDDITLGIMIFYGRALHGKGLPDAAVTVFSKAVRRKKGRNPELLKEGRYWRALAYHASGKKSRARQEWEKLYAEDPNYRDVAQYLGTTNNARI